MTNTFDLINVEKPVEVLNLISGQTVEYPLLSKHILEGNGLRATVTTENPSILKANAYSSINLKITWSSNLDPKEIQKVLFYENNAVILTLDN